MKKIVLTLVFKISFFSAVFCQWSEVNNLIFDKYSMDLTHVKSNKIWHTKSTGSTGNIITEYDSVFNYVKEINLAAYNVSSVDKVSAFNSDTIFLDVFFKYNNSYKNGLLVTYNGGLSFTNDFFFNTKDFNVNGTNVRFFNTKVGYFIKDTIDNECYLTYQTYDAGNTWIRRNDCDYLNYNYRNTKTKKAAFSATPYYYRQSGICMDLAWTSKYDSNYIVYTYNFGTTYSDRIINQLKCDRLVFKDASKFICYSGKNPFISYTSDSGKTFQSFQRNDIINSITFCENPNGNGFYVMSTPSGIYINYNENDNWILVDKNKFNTAKFFNTTIGYALEEIDAFNYKVFYYAGLNSLNVPHQIEGKNSTISIYPNPSQNILNLQADESLLKDITNIQIINANGQMFTVKLNNSQIDISHLAQGFYCLIINSENGNYKLNFVKD